ncbi:MAG: hypothetical protein RSF93_02510 [Mucinivorans sp.]
MTFLLIILIVVVGMWLLRRLLPLLLMGLMSRAAKRGKATFYTNVPPGAGPQGANQTKSSKKEGEITIKVPQDVAEKGMSKTIGDYVDYQEEK